MGIEYGAILDEAKKLINGDRRNDYGAPEISFEEVATMWGVYLNTNIKPQDVAVMMLLLKVVRFSYGHTRDSLLDAAGYIGLADSLGDNEYKDKNKLEDDNLEPHERAEKYAGDCLKFRKMAINAINSEYHCRDLNNPTKERREFMDGITPELVVSLIDTIAGLRASLAYVKK